VGVATGAQALRNKTKIKLMKLNLRSIKPILQNTEIKTKNPCLARQGFKEILAEKIQIRLPSPFCEDLANTDKAGDLAYLEIR
jgi:hypothetical protein